jgi:hypothetical protein
MTTGAHLDRCVRPDGPRIIALLPAAQREQRIYQTFQAHVDQP